MTFLSGPGFGSRLKLVLTQLTANMLDISKLTYLLPVLKGDAQQCVGGLALNGSNYKAA